MKDLKHLSDNELISNTETLVRQEREVLAEILHHLREIERRRLFGKYSSLYAYAVKHLKYSEPQAYRRIEAMRVIRELPELETAIENGDVDLTLIGVAQAAFASEKKKGRAFSRAEKIEVFEAISGQSSRQAQKTVAQFLPEPPPKKDQVRGIAPGRNLATVELSDETLSKIERLKGWLAHKYPHLTMDELMGLVCDLALEQWDPAREPKRKTMKGTEASISRAIWKRDGGQCVNCGSTYALEEDHIIPESLGGEYTLENMRLLCKTCNQRAAIEKLGQDTMDSYLSPSAPKVKEGFDLH